MLGWLPDTTSLGFVSQWLKRSFDETLLVFDTVEEALNPHCPLTTLCKSRACSIPVVQERGDNPR